MGGCMGRAIEKELPLDWLAVFAAMKLSKAEIRKLYKEFRKVDMNNSGSVDIVEFLTLLDIERTAFTERIFKVFDQDGTGKVDFREFVMSLWNYCTLGDASLGIFTFDLYDRDGSGVLSIRELEQMAKDIYGRGYEHNPKAKAVFNDLKHLETDRDINIEIFRKFVKTHQNLMFPTFQLQHQLQHSVMGRSWWIKASKRRIELSKGKYVTMAELMEIHLHEDLYRRVVEQPTLTGEKNKQVNQRAQMLIDSTGTAHGRAITDDKYNKSHSRSRDVAEGGNGGRGVDLGMDSHRTDRSEVFGSASDRQMLNSAYNNSGSQHNNGIIGVPQHHSHHNHHNHNHHNIENTRGSFGSNQAAAAAAEEHNNHHHHKAAKASSQDSSHGSSSDRHHHHDHDHSKKEHKGNHHKKQQHHNHHNQHDHGKSHDHHHHHQEEDLHSASGFLGNKTQPHHNEEGSSGHHHHNHHHKNKHAYQQHQQEEANQHFQQQHNHEQQQPHHVKHKPQPHTHSEVAAAGAGGAASAAPYTRKGAVIASTAY